MFESVTLHLIPAQRHREKSHSSSRNQQGRNQKRNPAEKPLWYLDAVDDELVSSEDLLQDAAPGIESSGAGIPASCEHCKATTRGGMRPGVSSHVTPAHTSSQTFPKPVHKGLGHIIIWPEPLLKYSKF